MPCRGRSQLRLRLLDLGDWRRARPKRLCARGCLEHLWLGGGLCSRLNLRCNGCSTRAAKGGPWPPVCPASDTILGTKLWR